LKIKPKSEALFNPPAWLHGRRRRQLYTAIVRECLAENVKLKGRDIGLTGFAMSLEFLELVTKYGRAEWIPDAGEGVCEWGADGFGLRDANIAHLLRLVGAIPEKVTAIRGSRPSKATKVSR
jgi:hypothetical protein